ncbi:MAG TPA: redoxin family protein [Thermoanaerobaculia bacterium]|nr:redoxin family protein [Thermoanaerobaculia bacterium]
MRRAILCLLALAALAVPAMSEGDKGVCAVCGPREGAGLEPIEARATLRGREYVFCSLECKVEFLKDPAAFTEPPEKRSAPELQFASLDGAPVDLATLRGRVVLVDFWATWCRPCLAALPRLAELQRELGERGLAVVGASIDEDPAKVRKAIGAAAAYPVGLVGADDWNRWGVLSLPALFLVDREGMIVRRFGGEADPAVMRAAIEEVLAR